jgi:DNA-binding MarR family transcriptional regulator
MRYDLSRKRLRMFVERIIKEVFAKETGALRMQQIGMFTLIYVFQGEKKNRVTASRIAEMTGQTSGQVHRQLKKLLDLGLIDRDRSATGRAAATPSRSRSETPGRHAA